MINPCDDYNGYNPPVDCERDTPVTFGDPNKPLDIVPLKVRQPGWMLLQRGLR